MKRINTQAELAALALELGVRADWHEPDEQGVTAVIKGTCFDNAGFWPAADPRALNNEKYVELRKDGEPVAAVNLATLLSWGARA